MGAEHRDNSTEPDRHDDSRIVEPPIVIPELDVEGMRQTGDVPTPEPPARAILNSVTEINDLLLAPEGPHRLFTGLAQVTAHTFDYPFVPIPLLAAALT